MTAAHDTRAAFVAWHGARIAMSSAEAEALRARGVIFRPEPEAAPAVYLPKGGRGLDEVGAELAALRARRGHPPVLFETTYVLAVPRGGRTLYLDEEGGFSDEPDAALVFTPEGRRTFEADGSFAFHAGAEWHERLGDPIAPLPEPADPPPALPPDPAHPARGREAVEALKRAWREDPGRDLAATPGYEAHRAELAAYQAAARARAPINTACTERADSGSTAVKTRPEIERLKADWLRDPCWDVEGTGGFEDHRDELQAFRLAAEARWKAAEDAREAEIDAEAERLGVPGLLRLLRQLEAVQRRHDAALLHLTEGRAHAAWCALTGREK